MVRLPSVGVAIGGQSATTATAAGSRSRASRTAPRPGRPAGHATGLLHGDDGRRHGAGERRRSGPGAAPDRHPQPAERLPGLRRQHHGRRGLERRGYRDYLREQLRTFWGRADIVNDGAPGTRSNAGRSRLPGSLPIPPRLRAHPLRHQRLERDRVPERLPLLHDRLAAIDDPRHEERRRLPDRRHDPARQSAVRRPQPHRAQRLGAADERPDPADGRVRSACRSPRSTATSLKQPSLPPLFEDFLHPNDRGYQLISQAFFRAITQPLAGASATADEAAPVLFVRPGHRH